MICWICRWTVTSQEVQMEIQKGVKFVGRKLLYASSPLKRAYPNGLSTKVLEEHSSTKREKLLMVYRNLIRLTRYLQFHTYEKKALHEIYRIKLRQDYSYRYTTMLNRDIILNDEELYERLVNTVHFIHNACLDSETNKTQRPLSMEFSVLSGIIKYEISKNLFTSLTKKLESKFIKLDMFMEMRRTERSWFMQSVDNEFIGEQLWWLDLEKGMLKNDVCFDYIKEIHSKKDKLGLLDKMVYSNIEFEKALVLMNEECKILL